MTLVTIIVSKIQFGNIFLQHVYNTIKKKKKPFDNKFIAKALLSSLCNSCFKNNAKQQICWQPKKKKIIYKFVICVYLHENNIYTKFLIKISIS